MPTEDEKPYYAVLSGGEVKIFRDFNECRYLVDGVRGSKVRKCNTLKKAESYVKNPDLFNQVNLKKKVNSVNVVYSDLNSYAYSYIDGSYNGDTKTYGYGGFIDTGGTRYVISGSGSDIDKCVCGSLAGELLGVLALLKKAYEVGIKNLIIYFDCSTITDWLDNLKRDSAFRKYYKDGVQAYISKGMNIIFKKVRAHSSIKGNEIADTLARESVGLDDVYALPISFFNVNSKVKYFFFDEVEDGSEAL